MALNGDKEVIYMWSRRHQLKNNVLKSITLKYCDSGPEVYELSSFIHKKIGQTISEQSQQMKE